MSQPKAMAVPEFADTLLSCRDGTVYGERSFLRRLHVDFAQRLCHKSGETYELAFPRESVQTLRAVVEYLQYLFEEFGLKGFSSRHPTEHNPPLLAQERAAVVGFFCRQDLTALAEPFFSKISDAEEAELLWEAVCDNEELPSLPEWRQQVELGLLTGILIQGQEEQPVALNLSLQSYRTAWRLLENLLGSYEAEKAQAYRQAFNWTLKQSGFETTDLDASSDGEIFPVEV